MILEPRTPARIQQLCTMMERSAPALDQRHRSVMIAQLYLLAEDLIGGITTPEIELKARVRLLIDAL